MHRSSPRRIVVVVAFAAAALAACGGSDATQPQLLTLSVSPTTTTVAQGLSATVTVNVGRTNYTGDVSLTATGVPAGVTAAFAPATLSGGTASSALTFTATTVADTGRATVTIVGSGDGVAADTVSVDLAVTSNAAFALTLLPTERTIVQGDEGSVTVNVTRYGRMNGDVHLAASGLPDGVTASFSSETVVQGAASSVVTFTAAAGAVAGTHTVTIAGSSPGYASHGASLALTVAPAGSATDILLNFCPGDVPTWVAYQNDGGAWTATTVTNASVAFAASSSRVGLAMVFADPVRGTDMEVSFVTTGDLAAVNGRPCVPATGSATLHGSIAGIGEGGSANVAMGDAFTTVVADGAFRLDNVRPGPIDLFAVRYAAGTPTVSVPDRIIARRDLDVPSGSAIPTLDFGAAEALAPPRAILSVTNGQSADVFGSAAIVTGNGTAVTLFSRAVMADTVTVYGLPASAQRGADLYALSGWAAELSSERSATLYATSFGDAAVALGPALAMPTITTASTSPYVRLRIQLPRQAEYGRSFAAVLVQPATGRSVTVTASAAYAGDATTWDLTIPDLSAATGWNNGWGITNGEAFDWAVSALGASFDPYDGEPANGATELYASQASTEAAELDRLLSRGLRLPARDRRLLPFTTPRFLRDRATLRVR